MSHAVLICGIVGFVRHALTFSRAGTQFVILTHLVSFTHQTLNGLGVPAMGLKEHSQIQNGPNILRNLSEMTEWLIWRKWKYRQLRLLQ
jgi:hypothetical protein